MTHTVAQTFGWLLLAWIGALVVVVAYRMVQGDIPFDGLLSSDGDRYDPERVQSLAVFLFVIVAYLGGALAGTAEHHRLPDIPASLLALLAGSNGLFIGGKIARQEIQTRKTTPRRGRLAASGDNP